jgi:glyoxylase-like metal-dependent hydrolase (beta-lactamase superfamily II)
MDEILPGLFHWTATHPHIHSQVSSYWLDNEGVLFDPLIPPDVGLEWFAERDTQPQAVLLSNRHHSRESARFSERFGAPVYCNRVGLHEFTHGEEIQGFDPGEELPGGVVAHEMGGICPDDSALYIPEHGAIVFADGIVRGGPIGTAGPLGFVPDSLMDDPDATKRALLASCARLLEQLDFEHLLLAHGGPLVGDGRTLLQDLVDSGGRTAFEM